MFYWLWMEIITDRNTDLKTSMFVCNYTTNFVFKLITISDYIFIQNELQDCIDISRGNLGFASGYKEYG